MMAVVAGGQGNVASGRASAVVGGGGLIERPDGSSVPAPNVVEQDYGFIGAGQFNAVGPPEGSELSPDRGFVGAGYGNRVTATDAVVVGGAWNEAAGPRCAIGGGENNVCSAVGGTVAGGHANRTTHSYATVAGGNANEAAARFATVTGGRQNQATGTDATVVGGYRNVASGAGALAAGRDASAEHALAFVWSDGQQDGAVFSSHGDYTFSVHARNGARFVGDADGSPALAVVQGGAGALVTGDVPGQGRVFTVEADGDVQIAGVLQQGSDRESKHDITPVDPDAVLDKVADLPISTWRYREDADDALHIGPMAQDFHAAFGVGADERHIAAIDADGVALAAIQALHARLEAERARSEALAEELEAERARHDALEARIERLEAMRAGP